MSFHQGDPKADEKQYALPIKKWKDPQIEMGPKKTQVEDVKGIHLQHPSRRKGRGGK